MYSRMMIMEAVSETEGAKVTEILRDHTRDCNLEARIERECDGNMIVLETWHANRDALRTYHTTPGYRTMLNAISHLLIGDPVVKRFEVAYQHVPQPADLFEIPF